MISHLGRYEIVSELGQGAMGVVYKATDPLIDRIVAIKTITLSLAQDDREEYEARFYQEAKAAGRLKPSQYSYHFRRRPNRRYCLHRDGISAGQGVARHSK